MKIARFWAKAEADAAKPDGRSLRIACWRWSETSQEEANGRAKDAVRDAVARVTRGEELRQGYGYLDRPPREEIVEEIKDTTRQTVATVTRNSYGSLILNTNALMFIDVDTPSESTTAAMIRGIKGLLGRTQDDPATALRKRLAQTAASYPELTVRLYETFAGYRCAIVNRSISAGTRESDQLLNSFEADPLYARLCQSQDCFRVRLTPKHWRCKVQRPPARFPWESKIQEQEYRNWQAEYERQCRAYATCRFLEQYGRRPIADQLQPLIDLHDEMTGADVDSQSITGLA